MLASSSPQRHRHVGGQPDGSAKVDHIIIGHSRGPRHGDYFYSSGEVEVLPYRVETFGVHTGAVHHYNVTCDISMGDAIGVHRLYTLWDGGASGNSN